ncbi:unnamed protein product, partial [Amoebophrya sp. A25]|eukprot:GSA25T00008299001.1
MSQLNVHFHMKSLCFAAFAAAFGVGTAYANQQQQAQAPSAQSRVFYQQTPTLLQSELDAPDPNLDVFSNPPVWPKNTVAVLESDEVQSPQDKQAILDAIFVQDENGAPVYSVNGGGGFFNELGRQFSTARHAILFKPGRHSVSLSLGYYHHMMGLGMEHPGQTYVEKVQVLNGSPDFKLGSLCNFWRAGENFATNEDINWWVSQGNALRRVVIGNGGNLLLSGMDWPTFQFGYSSGGYVADVKLVRGDATLVAVEDGGYYGVD